LLLEEYFGIHITRIVAGGEEPQRGVRWLLHPSPVTKDGDCVQRWPFRLQERRDVAAKPEQPWCRSGLPLSIAPRVDRAGVVGIHDNAPPETQPPEAAESHNPAKNRPE
jgi:hypothetical protein